MTKRGVNRHLEHPATAKANADLANLAPLLPELDDGYMDLDPSVLDELLAKSQPNRDYILRLKQDNLIPAEVLDVIRDLLLAGDDVDALAILSTELGMVALSSVEERQRHQACEEAWRGWLASFCASNGWMYDETPPKETQDQLRVRFDAWWKGQEDAVKNAFHALRAFRKETKHG